MSDEVEITIKTSTQNIIELLGAIKNKQADPVQVLSQSVVPEIPQTITAVSESGLNADLLANIMSIIGEKKIEELVSKEEDKASLSDIVKNVIGFLGTNKEKTLLELVPLGLSIYTKYKEKKEEKKTKKKQKEAEEVVLQAKEPETNLSGDASIIHNLSIQERIKIHTEYMMTQGRTGGPWYQRWGSDEIFHETILSLPVRCKVLSISTKGFHFERDSAYSGNAPRGVHSDTQWMIHLVVLFDKQFKMLGVQDGSEVDTFDSRLHDPDFFTPNRPPIYAMIFHCNWSHNFISRSLLTKII